MCAAAVRVHAHAASPHQELCKGEDLKQEMQLTLENRVTSTCTGRARAAAVHVAARAAVIVCVCVCTDPCHILTSLRLRHFPSALMRGRGGTKDFAFLLAPSLHRSGASAARCATKMQKSSLDLHAPGAFVRPERACPCTGRGYDCTRSAGVAKRRKCANVPQRLHDGPGPAAQSS